MTTDTLQDARPARPGFLVRQGVVELDLRMVVYTVWMSLLTAVFKEVVGNDTIVFIGSYNLTVVEPVVAMQVASLVLLASKRALRADIITWFLLGIAAIIFINLGRGIADDMPSGVRSFRIQGAFALYLLIAAFLPRDENMLRQIRDALIAFGLVLCVLVALRVVLGPQLFLREIAEEVTSINDGGRPVSADGALMIGAALILAVSRAIERVRDGFTRASVLAIPVLFVALILTAQATATISSLVGLVVVSALHPSADRGSRLLLVAVLVLAGGLFYLALTGAFGRFSLDFLPKYFQYNLLRRSSTIEVRHMIWSGLMHDYWRWSLLEQLIGLRNNDLPYIFVPLSSGYYWWASIHSMYYGAFAFMGVVGLGLYLFMVSLIGLRGLRRAFGPRWTWTSFGGAIPLALLAAFSLFGYSYELRDEHTVLILVALVASRPIINAAKQAAGPGFSPVRLTGNR